jgi:hypothetical protein
MKPNTKTPFSAKNFLAKAGAGRSLRHYAAGHAIFTQADAADAIFYIRRGRVKLTVVSSRGKQAVIAILGGGGLLRRGMPGRASGPKVQRGRNVGMFAGAAGESRGRRRDPR